MFLRYSLFLFSLWHVLFPDAIAACYYPNGTLESNTEYEPCVATIGTISMCCATNRPPDSQPPPDECLPNGLCRNTCTDFVNTGSCGTETGYEYWRSLCTGKSSNRFWRVSYSQDISFSKRVGFNTRLERACSWTSGSTPEALRNL
jgi:hypothetical protein